MRSAVLTVKGSQSRESTGAFSVNPCAFSPFPIMFHPSPPRAGIQYRQPDNASAIFAEENIVIHFDSLGGVLWSAEAHI